MKPPILIAGTVFILAGFLSAGFVFAQYDYYDPYSNSNIDYYPMNPVYTAPSNTTVSGTSGGTTGGTSDSSTSGGTTVTTTTTTCANKPLANPQNTRSVEIRDKGGKVFYLSPPKEELVWVRAYPETGTKIFQLVYGSTGMQIDEKEIGYITVSNNCYPKYGYVKNETTVTSTATTPTAPVAESTVVPVDKTAVTLDPATGKVYHAKTGVLIADARYDALLRKIFYKDTDATFGKVFTETTGYVNIDPVIKVMSPAPAIYQNNQTDLDYVKYPAPEPVKVSPAPSSIGDLDRDSAPDVVGKTALPSSGDRGNNENWDFGGSDTVAPEADGEEGGNVEYGWKVEKGESISVDGDLVRGWDPEKKKEVMAEKKAFAEMRSGQDLEHFAAGILLDDDAIREVKVTEDLLEVESDEKGKLFWFIPVTLTSRVVVKLTPSDGGEDGASVSVRFPWWSMFVKKTYSADDMERELRGALSAFAWEKVDNSEAPVPSESVADTTGTFDPTKWGTLARTLGLVSNIMKTKHDTVKNSISNVR